MSVDSKSVQKRKAAQSRGLTPVLSDGTDGFLVAEFSDPKGGDPAEWPTELRVHQYPEVKS